MVIIVDVMGGDNAPLETVKGLCMAAEIFPDVGFTAVGDKNTIEKILSENQCNAGNINIVNASGVVNMEDNPMCVVHEKSDSSMNVALTLLAEGKGDALVSTGNTGALFTGATLIVHKIKGVQRAAIASVLPMKPPVLLLDSGANVTVTCESIEQFAVMGSSYTEKLFGIADPRVGLLNNGTEDCKGTPLAVECHKRLSELPGINFVGNVEGNMLPFNVCDVLVTDGFTGNVLVKTYEGLGKMILGELKNIYGENLVTKFSAALVRKQIMQLKKDFDVKEYGGAPLLGIAKPVIKAHGSSKAKAFSSAIKQAVTIVRNHTMSGIESKMAEYTEYRKARKKSNAESEN